MLEETSVGTKNPTDILKEEHDQVKKRLDTLEGVINDLGHRDEISAKLKDLMSFFASDFWMHFDKEEKALFPEFDNFMPRGAGPLAAMMDEHEVIRNTNDVLQEAVARYLDHDDGPETRKTIIESGTHFVGFLRGHIFKEDGILFRMAEMHLNQRQNEKVAKLFSEMEKAGEASPRTRADL